MFLALLDIVVFNLHGNLNNKVTFFWVEFIPLCYCQLNNNVGLHVCVCVCVCIYIYIHTHTCICDSIWPQFLGKAHHFIL